MSKPFALFSGGFVSQTVVVSINGGVPFQELFENPVHEVTVLQENQSVWVLQASARLANESVFQGVVDWEVSGASVQVDCIAFANASRSLVVSLLVFNSFLHLHSFLILA
jgi:hypothetical protein